ncbi:MAG: hypothetical protein WBI14_06000 [Anaerolineaceae bacterium]
MEKLPELTFFTELDSEKLTQLFNNRFVIDDLRALKAGVSIGMLDLSIERAAVVKKLNRFNIPVVGWLLLPKEQGYWFNLENFPYAIARYEAFKSWTVENKLEFVGIGLDIEPDFHEAEAFKQRQLKVVKPAFRRLIDKKAYRQAVLAYTGLVNQIHADSWLVEGYDMVAIQDDRKARSTAIQRVMGLVDLPVDRSVLMLYSSFSRPNGHKLLQAYLLETDSVGIGVTGGGVEMEGLSDKPFMTWEEFSTDLRLAWQAGKPIHVFSLEGCVEQGWLERLNTFEWSKSVENPNTQLVKLGRVALQTTAWLIERPLVALLGVGGVLSGLLIGNSKAKKKRNLR